jgi:hypothetical protein
MSSNFYIGKLCYTYVFYINDTFLSKNSYLVGELEDNKFLLKLTYSGDFLL